MTYILDDVTKSGRSFAPAFLAKSGALLASKVFKKQNSGSVFWVEQRFIAWLSWQGSQRNHRVIEWHQERIGNERNDLLNSISNTQIGNSDKLLEPKNLTTVAKPDLRNQVSAFEVNRKLGFLRFVSLFLN